MTGFRVIRDREIDEAGHAAGRLRRNAPFESGPIAGQLRDGFRTRSQFKCTVTVTPGQLSALAP